MLLTDTHTHTRTHKVIAKKPLKENLKEIHAIASEIIDATDGQRTKVP